jgi:hypothetical protein
MLWELGRSGDFSKEDGNGSRRIVEWQEFFRKENEDYEKRRKEATKR